MGDKSYFLVCIVTYFKLNIFFSCCVKGSSPQVGDRVLVEAVYNANMPFKWNATRIQVLSMQDQRSGQNYGRSQSNYNAVPPPSKLIYT